MAIELAGGLRKLARAHGVSPGTISNWRNEKTCPGGATVSRMLDDVGAALGVALLGRRESGGAGEPDPAQASQEPPSEPEIAQQEAPKGEPESVPPLEQLRRWVTPAVHPGWLCRAASQAKSLRSLALRLGATTQAGRVHQDPDRALARLATLTCEASPWCMSMPTPPAVGQLLGEVAALLEGQGARQQAVPVHQEPMVQRAKRELEAKRVRAPR